MTKNKKTKCQIGQFFKKQVEQIRRQLKKNILLYQTKAAAKKVKSNKIEQKPEPIQFIIKYRPTTKTTIAKRGSKLMNQSKQYYQLFLYISADSLVIQAQIH
ncbi:unnamed protein product (macronuclear) [Paramecium tetraurelia]|uniref:Uncharacterized protein n=1 Tax=Paramecium tetraurelia TaxID=5888 RepID=A0CFH6_PARTE|nr:uncharacterized protein GSPATT00037982001 [Paramecium tetraurelia]CAK69543.1 unnamed protein product [Paramecium tetraurelia]|eukprot:XP_001436940.1 hypothetical protein (macronuclear) [Paramecium tetraurelia strain d4-2]